MHFFFQIECFFITASITCLVSFRVLINNLFQQTSERFHLYFVYISSSLIYDHLFQSHFLLTVIFILSYIPPHWIWLRIDMTRIEVNVFTMLVMFISCPNLLTATARVDMSPKCQIHLIAELRVSDYSLNINPVMRPLIC